MSYANQFKSTRTKQLNTHATVHEGPKMSKTYARQHSHRPNICVVGVQRVSLNVSRIYVLVLQRR
jgi:hypothetical protein